MQLQTLPKLSIFGNVSMNLYSFDLMECKQMFPGFIIGLLVGIVSVAAGAFIAHMFAVNRDLKCRVIQTFILSSELLLEVDIFLKSQKHFCENYDEYVKRSYYQEDFQPLEDIGNLINLKNKGFSDFFNDAWLDKFYSFIAYVEICMSGFSKELNQLKATVENLYPEREISSVNDSYEAFYEYVDKTMKVQFDNIHNRIKDKMS